MTERIYLVHWKEHIAGIFKRKENAEECARRYRYEIDQIETDIKLTEDEQP
jgi:hypothetical protein